MAEKDSVNRHDEDDAAFDRRFRYAIAAFAVVELIVIALVVYYKIAR